MKLSAKLFSTVAACGMVLSLAACGNTTKTSSAKSEAVQSSKVNKKNNSSKKKVDKNSQKSSSSTTSSSEKYAVTATTSESANSSNESTQSSSSSVVKKQNSSQQATMNATDAKNIVKEHIGNQLNNRGIAGQSTSDLPSIDSIDGYTTTQNGTNDWTVSGNGHTYHVTANSVTGN
jgi:DNA polymerase II small subunit/DNA polymerase delta subunit B